MEERIIDVGKVSTKNQVTIPKAVRDRFGIKVGDRLLFIEKKGELVLRKA